MVHTAHFAGQTNLLVPRCFNLKHCNSIKIGRIDGSCVPDCVLPGLRPTPCGKACPNVQVRACKSEHEGTQTRHFCLVRDVGSFQKGTYSRLQIELYAPGRCALISQFLPVMGFLVLIAIALFLAGAVLALMALAAGSRPPRESPLLAQIPQLRSRIYLLENRI